jgi:hypothetical protein
MMSQQHRSGPFAFERTVFRKFWLLLGGATFTVIGFIWLLTQWGRRPLLVTEATAAVVLFYLGARTAWKDERRSLLAEQDARNALEAQLVKPQRTPAKQHDYDTAKEAIEPLGEKGVTALRHLRRQGSAHFSFQHSSAPLPPGMTFNDTLWVYEHCASKGLLTRNEKSGSGDKTFAVSPKMSKILDDVLYPH